MILLVAKDSATQLLANRRGNSVVFSCWTLLLPPARPITQAVSSVHS